MFLQLFRLKLVAQHGPEVLLLLLLILIMMMLLLLILMMLLLSLVEVVPILPLQFLKALPERHCY